MRLLLVTPHFLPNIGGVERHVARLGRGLVEQGHDVTVATVDASGDLPREESLDGMKVLRFHTLGRGAYNAPLSLLGYLARHGRAYDAVHAFNYGALPLLFTVLTCGKRCFISPCYHREGHTRAATLLRRLYDPFASRAIRKCAGVICLSKGEAREVMDRLGVPAHRIKVVPAGVAVEAHSDDGSAPISREPGLILSVGRLEAYKHVDRAIEAVAHLGRDYRLVVAGDGPDRTRLQALATSLGLGERVRFLGRVSDVELRELYARAGLVVTFSRSESFGITVLEALAHGNRVVCSDIPAFRDFGEEFAQAVTIAPDATGARGLARLLAAEASKEPAPMPAPDLTPYRWETITERLVRMYSRVAGRTKAHLSSRVRFQGVAER